ncbi:chloroplast trigger factor [Haematococcus lacustris]
MQLLSGRLNNPATFLRPPFQQRIALSQFCNEVGRSGRTCETGRGIDIEHAAVPHHLRYSITAAAATAMSGAGTGKEAEVPELQVVSETLSACARRLTVTVPQSYVDRCFRTTVSKLREITGNVAGFRKDKIPLNVIISQTGGQRQFKIACIEEILMTTMQPVLGELQVVVPGSEKVTSEIDKMEAAFDPSKPFTFCIEYDTVPPVVWKKSYKDVEVSLRDTGDFKTDMAAVEDLIRQFLKEKGHQRVVSGRGLQQGDTAIMDMKFTEVGGALPLPGLSAERARFDTEMDPFDLTPHLLGISVGEERRFQITIPEDCSVELWQGMVCDVQAKVREIFSWTLPAFDDAFVKNMSQGKFESAQEMKKSLLATTAMERVKDLDMRLGEAVQKAVVECVDIPHLPETLVLDMAATQYKALLLSMIERRQATREEVENLATEELVEEFLQKRRQDIEDLCKFNIAADEIYATEGLTLEEEDVQAEVNNRMKDYEAQDIEYDEGAIRDQVIDTFKHVKVVEWLKDNVKRTVLPYEEEAATVALQ